MPRQSWILIAVLMSPSPARATLAECAASPQTASEASTVEIYDAPSDLAEFKMLIVNADRGAFMRIYFDGESETIARAEAPCFAMQLNLLRKELLDERDGAEWDAVVFSSNPDYRPPRGQEAQTRWVVSDHLPDPDAPGPRRMLRYTLPHEQIHRFQKRQKADVPRWFAEGHASWSGFRVAAILDPELKEIALAELRAQSASGPANLINWSKSRPRREAIMRQVSEEDRLKMEADPDYLPHGTFRFTLDDFETDETNTPARYAAAYRVFEGLAERHGADSVRRWASEVTAQAGKVTEAALTESVAKHFGEDLKLLLRD